MQCATEQVNDTPDEQVYNAITISSAALSFSVIFARNLHARIERCINVSSRTRTPAYTERNLDSSSDQKAARLSRAALVFYRVRGLLGFRMYGFLPSLTVRVEAK